MKIALFSVSLLACSIVSAQCHTHTGTTTTTTGTTYSSSDNYSSSDSYTNDDDDSGYDDDDESSEWPIMIGGGIHMGLPHGFGKADVARGLLGNTTNKHWNLGEPNWFIDISTYPIVGKKLSGFIGASVSYNRLWALNYDMLTSPVLSAPNTLPLSWSSNFRFSTTTMMGYIDVALGDIAYDAYFFARGELGYTSYDLSAELTYVDTCGCDVNKVLFKETRGSMTGGLAFGFNLGSPAISLKPIIGYRLYNPMGVLSRDYVQQWSPEFDASGYDFTGGLREDMFSLATPESTERIGQRMGVFYFQVSLAIGLSGEEMGD